MSLPNYRIRIVVEELPRQKGAVSATVAMIGFANVNDARVAAHAAAGAARRHRKVAARNAETARRSSR